MSNVVPLLVSLGVMAAAAVSLIVWVLCLQSRLAASKEQLRLAQNGPINLSSLMPGVYRVIALYYDASMAFGSGEIHDPRRGLMQVRRPDGEAVLMVLFSLDDFDDLTVLTNGIEIDVTIGDGGRTLFHCVN